MTDAIDATEVAAEEGTETAAPGVVTHDDSEVKDGSASDTVVEATETADEGAEAVADGGGDDKPPVKTTSDEDLPDNPLAFLASKRVIYQLFGTLLIIGGIVTIGLTVGLSAWNKHQQDSETQAFLRRVNTPRPFSGTTPFPSTVSGALIPNNVQTPTANAATRAAQPVATTTDGKDRSIITPLLPAATATPVPTSAGSEPPTTVPTPTPKPKLPLPTHLTIPSIGVDSDIVEVGVSPVEIDGQELLTWDVAPYAVGHNFSSASPGEGENIVLSGHDDWQGEVFKNLYKIKQGAEVDVTAGDRVVKYRVDDILLLPEVGETLEKRLENAKFIGTTGDERVTLVTCWPYGVDDHRVVVIAHPMQ